MSPIKAWITAFRLRTLPLSFSSILMGSFVAAYHHAFQWMVLILALTTTLFLQVLSNLANDYGDTINGADHEGRQGPQRMVQSGAIPLSKMKLAIVLFAFLSFISGLALLYVSFDGWMQMRFLLFILMGIAAIVAALRYTMGANPYGYKGLGDVYVLIFFGLVGVAGTYFLHANSWEWIVFLPAVSVGLLSAGVLNVNNMRDVDSDLKAGKKTMVVKLGLKAAKVYHYLLLGFAMMCLLCFVFINGGQLFGFLFLLVVPLLGIHIRAIVTANEATDFDPQLKKLSLLTLATVMLFGVGLILN